MLQDPLCERAYTVNTQEGRDTEATPRKTTRARVRDSEVRHRGEIPDQNDFSECFLNRAPDKAAGLC